MKTLEQRLSLLEKRVGIAEQFYSEDYIKRIKFSGGELRRFTKEDYSKYSETEYFPSGQPSFIGELKLGDLKDDLSIYFEVDFKDFAIIIFSYFNNKYYVSISAYSLEYNKEFSRIITFKTFDLALTWITKNLRNPLHTFPFINPKKWTDYYSQ